MKKLVVALLSIFAFSTMLHAQDLGIKISTIYSDLVSKNIETMPKVGHGVNAVAHYNIIKDEFTVLYEVGYADIGAKILIKADEVDSEPEYQKLNVFSLDAGFVINYFILSPELSVQAGLKFSVSKFTRFKDEYQFYRYGTSEELSGHDSDLDFQTLEELAGIIGNSRDFSGIFGISAGQDYMRVSLRYYLGLTPFKNKSFATPIEIKSNFFELSGMFLF